MKTISSMQNIKTYVKKTLQQKCFCYGGRDDISMQTILENTRIFGHQEQVNSHIEIHVERRFCNYDFNFMNSGVNS